MFSSPSFRLFGQTAENKDALMARKPGLSNSARKPLADRAVNESKSLKPESTKPKGVNKPGLSAKKASPKAVDLPEWPPVDTFSFKQVEDTYEDIFPKSERINAYDFISMVYPHTPPLKEEIQIDPMFLELPQESYLKFRDDDEMDLEKNPIMDVDFPDFDLLIDTSY